MVICFSHIQNLIILIEGSPTNRTSWVFYFIDNCVWILLLLIEYFFAINALYWLTLCHVDFHLDLGGMLRGMSGSHSINIIILNDVDFSFQSWHLSDGIKL